ncbi:MAG: hypothetical protein LBQ59_02570 [Candidatus Peribacteria bacterium]|jgi:hypothetical protein|nr:hypothetical protein [Candidatus Peribacteria bacterium]
MKKNMGTYKEFKEYSSPEYIETRNTIAKKYIPRFIQILERAIQLVNWEKNNRV